MMVEMASVYRALSAFAFIELRTAPRNRDDVVASSFPAMPAPPTAPAVPNEDSPTEARRTRSACTVPPPQPEAPTNVKTTSLDGREPCNCASPVAITPARAQINSRYRFRFVDRRIARSVTPQGAAAYSARKQNGRKSLIRRSMIADWKDLTSYEPSAVADAPTPLHTRRHGILRDLIRARRLRPPEAICTDRLNVRALERVEHPGEGSHAPV